MMHTCSRHAAWDPHTASASPPFGVFGVWGLGFVLLSVGFLVLLLLCVGSGFIIVYKPWGFLSFLIYFMGLGFGVRGLGSSESCLLESCLGVTLFLSRVSGLGFRVPGFGFRVSGFEFRVSGFGFWGSG